MQAEEPSPHDPAGGATAGPELEGYVRGRIRAYNAQPAMLQLLGPQAAAALQEATRTLLEGGAADAGGSGGADDEPAAQPAAPSAPRQLALVLRHDCLHLGCSDERCALCAENQQRRCSRSFSAKYLSGDVLKAACGAPIRVELVDRVTGRLVSEHAPLQLQIAIVDRKAWEGLATGVGALGGGDGPSEAELDRITLLQNQQGKPLLAAKQTESDSRGYVLVPLARGCAVLPKLSVTGSSEALLSGQRPPFALFARAVEAMEEGAGVQQGQRRAGIAMVVSEGFVVATPRVRSASKAPVPALTDHVSKLNAVGSATQAKLRDLPKAARDAGVHGLALPLAAANTVGEFRRLVQWAQEDATRCEQVKRMLKLTKGWAEAYEHAMKAVGTDARLRCFFADDSRSRGLLIGCKDAAPQLEEPLALIEAAADSDGEAMLRATLLPRAGQEMPAGVDADAVVAMQQQAKACWARRGHPGWAIVPLETADFQRGCGHLQQVLLPPHLAAAAVPLSSHTAPSFPAALASLAAPPAAPPASPFAPAGLAPPAAADDRATSPFGHGQLRTEFASMGVQSPGAPFRSLPLPAAQQAAEPIVASPFQTAADGRAAEGSSLVSRLLRSLGSPAPGSPPPLAGGGSGGESGAVPLHVQLGGRLGGRLGLASSGDSSGHLSSGHLPPSPFASEPSLTPPGLPPQVAAAAPATGAPAATASGQPAFDFHAAARTGLGSGTPPPILPPPPSLFLPETPQAAPLAGLLRTPSPGPLAPAAAPSAPAAPSRGPGGLPPLSLFGSEGHLGSCVTSLAYLQEGCGAEAAPKLAAAVPEVPSFGALPPGASVDWEALLREAYKTPSGTPLPPEPAEEAGSDRATPPLLPQQPAPVAAVPAVAALEVAASGSGGFGSTLLRMISQASDLGSLGTLAGSLGDVDWQQWLAAPTAAAAVAEKQTGGDGGGAAPAGAPAVAQQQSGLGRILTPDWAKLLSLTPGEWAALLQDARPAAQPAQQEQAAAAAAAPQVVEAEAGDGASGAQAPRRVGRKRQLTPSSSGVQEMDGLEQP